MKLIWIIIAFVIILEAKLIRDIISFRFSRSILTLFPAWLQDWLRKGYICNVRQNVFDGWHVSDAMMIAPSWVLAMWFYLGNFWWALASYVLFWVIFYQLFNFQYHWLWMLPEFRECPWRRK